MRRQVSTKSNTCMESLSVYAAGISVKVSAQYPGEICQPVTNYRHREVAGRAGRSQQRA